MSIDELLMFDNVAVLFTFSVVVLFVSILIYSVTKVLFYHEPRMKNVVKKMYSGVNNSKKEIE